MFEGCFVAESALSNDTRRLLMVSQELLDILRCPADVRNGPNAGLLDLVKETWLVCRDCGRKYPIKNDIPIMLIEEGDKYKGTPVEQLGAPA
jgi:uncharacterized protein YbaR (Trm112 family)